MQGQYVGSRNGLFDELQAAAEELHLPVTRPNVKAQLSWRALYVVALFAADMLAALGACGLSFLARGDVHHVQVMGLSIPFPLLITFSLPTWLFAMFMSGAYRPNVVTEELRDYRIAVVVGLRTMAVVVIASFAFKASLSRLLVLVYFPSLIVFAIAGRFAVRRGLAKVREDGKAQVRLLLVGEMTAARRVASHLHRHRDLGYQIVGACTPNDSGPFAFGGKVIPTLGSPDSVLAAARSAGAEAVAVANPSGFEELTLQKLAWALERSGIDLLVAPDVAEVAGPRIRVAPTTGLPLLHITEPRVDGLVRRMILVGSRLLAIPLTVLISPLLLGIAVAILIDSGWPIFYKQERIGYLEKPFRILKFRTMVPDAEAQLPQIIHLNEHDGALFKIRDDPRVTRIGRWLRRYSLDEIPQLLNVVKGDMVFVGPRPVLKREMSQFGQAEQRRFLTKPGMTGLWQVSGRADVPWEDAVQLDLYYVENWSPLLDLMILGKTLRTVLAGEGA